MVTSDSEKLNKLVDWMQSKRVTEGPLAGQFFEVLPWQRKLLADIVSDEVESVAVSVGRANGKSSFLALVASSFVLHSGPLLQQRGQCIMVASAFRQARLLYEHISHLIPSEDEWRYRINDTTNISRIEHRNSGAYVQAIGSDFRRASGLAPDLILADEGAVWEATKKDLMYETLITSLGKKAGGTFVALGTRPYDPLHWFSRMLDEQGMADAVHCYSTPESMDPFSEPAWHAANPSLYKFPWLLKTLRNEAERARRDSTALATFRKLRLNQAIPDSDSEPVIDLNTLKSIEVSKLPDRKGPMIMGIDLGSHKSMSCVVSFWPESKRMEVLGAFPSEPSLSERGVNDIVDSAYVEMAAEGSLIQVGAAIVDIRMLLVEARERFGEYPQTIVADRYRKAELEQALKAASFPKCKAVYRSQVWREASEDINFARRLILTDRVQLLPSILVRHAFSGAYVKSDLLGNLRMCRESEGGRRSQHRDDLVSAMLICLGEAGRQYAEQQIKPKRTNRIVAG